jgi:hypothetical protein
MTQNSRGGFVRTEEQALIDTEALRLRSQGMGYREIALAQGVDTSTAHRRVSRALGEIPQTIADEYRALELSRLDALQVAIWETALEGDYKAIRAVLDIMTKRSKLLGLDLVRTSTGTLDYTLQEIQDEIAKLERELGEA